MEIINLTGRFLLPLLLLAWSLTATAAERTVYLVNDALGSPVAAMDEQGAVLWRENYAPYGERRIKSPENPAHPAYTGKSEDADTGFVYMGARMYDPETARFTGMDPEGFKEGSSQSFGRYVYANNSPYVFVDPNGEFSLRATTDANDQARFNISFQTNEFSFFVEYNINSSPGQYSIGKLRKFLSPAEKIEEKVDVVPDAVRASDPDDHSDELIDLDKSIEEYVTSKSGSSVLGAGLSEGGNGGLDPGIRNAMNGAYESLSEPQKKVFDHQYGTPDSVVDRAISNLKKSN